MYYEKLDNGLEVYIVPKDNVNSIYVTFSTKFGSIHNEFVPYDRKAMTKFPLGIAHFLEHKLFEQEDGIDPFTFVSKTGTYSNASTNYTLTRYYFEGNKAFSENLDYLLNFVGSPYFTDENVLKEKGIIAEEIKQYDDEVEWFFDEEMKKAMLKKDNHRVDIAGTIESINEITKEDLYKTYYTFYQPSNMILVVSGAFNKEEAMEVIKNNEVLNSSKTNFKIKKKHIKEDIEVNEKEVNTKFNIFNTKVGLGIKLPIGENDRFLFNAYVAVLLNTKFGISSLFREKIKKDELMTAFYVERELIDDYMLIYFKADSNKPKKLIDAIREELKDKKITEEELERIKKVWISSTVMLSDDINASLENVVDDICTYGKLMDDKIEKYRSLNIKDYNKLINTIDFNNQSIVNITPIDKNN